MRGNLFKYLLVRPLAVLLLLIFFLLLAVAFLALTNVGTGFLASNSVRFVPGLKLENVRGALASGVGFGRLHWKNDDVDIEALQVDVQNQVDWGEASTLRVDSLNMEKLIIRVPHKEEKTTDSAEKFQFPSIILPFNIDARKADIGELEVWAGDYPLRFRNIELSAKTRDGVLELGSLKGQAYDEHGQADLAASGRMKLSQPHDLDVNLKVDSDSTLWGVGKGTIVLGNKLQDYDITADADWQYADYPRYKGQLKGEGSFYDLKVDDLQLQGPAGQVQAKGGIGWSEGFEWQAKLKGEQVNPEPFVKEIPAKLDVDLDSTGKLAHGKTDITLDFGRVEGKLRDYPLNAKGKADWNGKLLAVHSLDALVGKNHLQATGDVSDQLKVKWELDAPELSQLYPKLKGKLQGAGSISGQTDGSRLQLDVTRLEGKLRDYPVKAEGKADWNGKLLAVRALDVLVGKNRLQATGDVAETLQVKWNLDAPNLSQLYPKIKGSAKGNGVINGKADGSQLQLDVAELKGRVEGYDLDAKGKLDWGDNKLAAEDVLVRSGNNRLEVSGQALEPFDLRWKVDAKNLANAWKGLGGSLQGEGFLKGKLDKLEIQADLQGSKLRYQDYHLGSLDMQAKQTGERYDIKGVLQGLKSGDADLLKTARIDGEGSIENHHLSAQVSHPEGKLDFAAQGGLRNGQWSGSVQNLSLSDTPAGDWKMASAVNLRASAKEFSSSEICLLNHAARACGKPAWTQRGGFNVEGLLRQIPLAMLRPWLPDNLSLPGQANADFNFAQRGGKPQGRVDLRLPDSSLTLRDNKGKAETLQYRGARADINLNDRRMDLQTQLELVNRGRLQGDGVITFSPQDGRHQINARLNATLPDIGWMSKFSTQIDQLKGQITGDVQLSGALSKPAVTGTVRLANGQVHLPETGVTLEAIALNMQSSGGDRAVINGSLRAGEGVLNASGFLSLANLPKWEADVKLQGNNLKLMDTHEVQALVSPDLHIQASPADVSITGKVFIPQTLVSLRELPATASALSEDVVIVGRGKGPHGQARQKVVIAKEAPLNIHPNVMIVLGDKVKFTGFGLDTRLTGSLKVLRTRQDIVAEGVLSVVDGVYKAYGQNLAIERGRLIFNGPIDNPGLDVRAVRSVEDGDIKVGIELSGTVQKPESTLFSSPTQTQSNTLSYLLTGHAMSSLSGGESSVLLQAITGLGIAGGESLAQSVGGRVGLDEVGINAKGNDFEQSELLLGKRLGPKLYVRYIVSLFDSLQRLAVTYQLNKRLQVEAQSGLHQSIDLIYKVDTNRGPFGK